MSTPTPIPPTSTSPPTTFIGSLEARVKALETKTESWFSKNWPHLVTWALGAFAVIRHLF